MKERITPSPMWWSGDERVEPFMKELIATLDKYMPRGKERTEIYNRAYEAVYKAIVVYGGNLEK